MYNHFVYQLTDAKLMDVNKKYKNILTPSINNTTSLSFGHFMAGDYETEMKRSMILENLQHIHENLCFESGIKPSNPYRRMRPIAFTNKKIQSC